MTTTCWHEEFSAADSALFQDVGYATQTNGTALYTVTNGASTMVWDGVSVDFNTGSGTRAQVGSTAPATASTTTTAPPGMFNLSGKTCTMVIKANVAQTAGLFQVYVNNNTTGSANSPLGAASRVLNIGPANTNALAIGDNTFTFTVGTTSGTDFVYLRGDSSSRNVVLNSIKMDCI